MGKIQHPPTFSLRALERLWFKKVVAPGLVPISLYWKVKEGGGWEGHRLVETSILVRTLVFAKDRNPIPIYLEKERHKGFTGAGQ